jgi:hypothetical protein
MDLGVKGYLKERTMLQVLCPRISHIAHFVPYFFKEPVLSVLILNEVHIMAFYPYMGTIGCS